ncbi:MAG: DNA gyrase subunit A [Bdellovibrionales bacterium RIFOXYD12_FULL_39_22]|nr:MAG: DNA gyrase subunit A [Bdellovibrionales bacterium RIFOXYB1_FULL_39_21]OFZ45313.1 MAG: DNA gyrase subunit A [Bdellovibrionales bacterium RIFOXYC12_FULL_39_17]OFZ45696.1 MAG: DNA gyrase subunit A [Bdellovibrionales bacterium RIFOXYC1_FULL_39_130]OFZ77557.1 MAG: DNA gyrase subunit A [Bdellovibrionales bacterium RIFOXYD1_FULL_39_84]OFZ91686.1 MAG: DNA gyrase subunit A [Bdellovibrionales bacterium RIFOXYD12_FULL_39_22]
MKSCYIDYAMSVIIGRALPDVRDGLKPVHRRVLYAMHDLGNYHNKPFLKSARVVGDVIGKYHPHGDSAVYNTIVRMAQDFSLRYPLVDGQGNFGSIDGDSAAAMRYTEIRMQKMAEEMLADLEKETVDWQPNYDDSRKEPAVLPAKIPNLLINGSTGIAVGMATNIPPHNLKEITQGLIALLDDNNTSIEQLIKIIPGPDFPTAGAIHGVEGIRSAYRTGRGVIQIRSKYEIEEIGKTDRQRIVITELPYQVIKAKLIERIAELVNEKTIEGISGIRDESNRLGIRVCIDLKKGEIPAVVVNRLFKHTQMQESFGIIFLAIHNGAPKVMNLKEILSSFLEHRREIIIRRTIFDLNKAKAKAHILEGLKIAVENIDPIIRLIKSAEGPTEARDQLMSQYKLSEKQAQAILEMRLQRLTGLERDRIVKDYEDTLREIEGLERLLASEELIKQEMKREFQEILEKHGDERRTEIVGQVDDIDIVDMIKQEDVIVTTTHKGYIKRMAIDTYKTQKRGGVGVKGADALEDDFYNKIFIADTHAIILFFTNRGMVFAKHVYNIPEAVRTAKGRNIANLIPIPSDEKIMEVLCLPAEIENKFLMFATAKGVVKKSELSEYTNIKQNGIRALKLQDGDYIVSVRVTDGLKDVLLCSTAGKIIRFPETDCRPLGRVSQGVKGISIEEDEKIIGMEIIDDNVEILSITENGYGKRTVSADYRKQSRGGKGIIAMKLTEKNGDIIDIKPVTDKDDLMIITDKGQVVRTSIAGISLMGRTTQGVRIIKVKEGEKVVAVEKIAEAEHNENNDTAAENTNKKEDGSNNKVDE